MKIKTINNARPNGKSKVYFAAHADDFPVYFGPLTDELLEIYDCAIWYNDKVHSFTGEYAEDLAAMALFVIPVTHRLLENTACVALQEMRFALENHIPVLPVVAETGLVERFKNVCGNVQFLDRTNDDITALRYEDKLKRFVDAVMIKDELIIKIRDAFDACIFLSYRKKDRAQAHRLMRLIHSHESLRDFAIWYDEFLVPGEDFNEAIKTELRASRIFALALTEHILEKDINGNDNYVVRYEYRDALERQKEDPDYRIIPCRLAPISEEDLRKAMPLLPRVIDADDPRSFAACWEDAAGGIVREHRDDPQHVFFIGLAYLYGIDMEVDRSRAVTLIRTAADAGLPEAVEKMANLYRYGEAVDQSDENAVFWMKRLAQIYRNNNRSVEYAKTLTELLNYQIDIDSREKADTHRELESFAGRYEAETGDNSYTMVSMLYAVRVVEEEKAARMKRLLANNRYFEAEYEKSKRYLALQMLIQNYQLLGEYAGSASDIVFSGEYYEKAIRYCRVALQKRPGSTVRYLLCSLLTAHADVENGLKHYRTAKERADEAIEVANDLYAGSRTPDDRMLLASAYDVRGDTCYLQEKYEEAESCYLKAFENCNMRDRSFCRRSTLRFKVVCDLCGVYCSTKCDNLSEYYRIAGEMLPVVRSRADGRKQFFWPQYIQLAEAAEKLGKREESMEHWQYAFRELEGGDTDLLNAVGAAIYKKAKEYGSRDIQEKYRAYSDGAGKISKGLPEPAAFSVPSIKMLMPLWKHHGMGDEHNNVIDTYANVVAHDADEYQIKGQKITGLSEIMYRYIYYWRILFYPLLAWVFMLCIHLFQGYTGLSDIFRCRETGNMLGEYAAQGIVSTSIAVALCIFHHKSKTQRRIRAVALSIATYIISMALCVLIFTPGAVLPEPGHWVLATIPLFVALSGWYVTAIVIRFLRAFAKK